tara:strand:+ start:110 stop:571 length:462 start_codon:yes stop_codon:yes gene_type:complete
MDKKYGITELSDYSKNLKKDQERRRGVLKKIFSGPLFPKGTGGVLPKYDKAQEKKKLASIEDAMIVKPAKPKNPERASNKPSPVKTTSTKSKTNGNKKPKSFAEAFKMAKGQKTFTFKGKSYARVTKDELEKRGFKSLRAYLNAQKTTRVAKK